MCFATLHRFGCTPSARHSHGFLLSLRELLPARHGSSALVSLTGGQEGSVLSILVQNCDCRTDPQPDLHFGTRCAPGKGKERERRPHARSGSDWHWSSGESGARRPVQRHEDRVFTSCTFSLCFVVGWGSCLEDTSRVLFCGNLPSAALSVCCGRECVQVSVRPDWSITPRLTTSPRAWDLLLTEPQGSEAHTYKAFPRVTSLLGLPEGEAHEFSHEHRFSRG